ncbi:MerR family transcriptional regulator [Clostridium sp. BJN0013]|uniref:MerR family transcriptional regulator n=1 Tax=Clostridium sp. BJN0013 TaxID=3236840 RepID=UPI0034C5F252
MDYYLRGELAKEAGLNFETLRYYEKINLIPTAERNKSGYRLYPKKTLNRLKFIKMMQNCGFSISEIKHILYIIENPAECHEICDDIINRKMYEIEEKINGINHVKDMLLGIKENLKEQNCLYFTSLL